MDSRANGDDTARGTGTSTSSRGPDMADRVSVSITIGGKLPADRLPELYKLADFYGLSTEWGGEPLESVTSGEPLRLHAHEVQNGNIEDIEDFCCTNDLPFRTWSGGSPGSFSPEAVPSATPRASCARADDAPAGSAAGSVGAMV